MSTHLGTVTVPFRTKSPPVYSFGCQLTRAAPSTGGRAKANSYQYLSFRKVIQRHSLSNIVVAFLMHTRLVNKKHKQMHPASLSLGAGAN
jgi:hypothetical protein